MSPNDYKLVQYADPRREEASAVGWGILCGMLPILLPYWAGVAIFVAARATVHGAGSLLR